MHCSNSFEAKKASAVNNANCLVLAEWLTPGNHAAEIIDDWMATEFGDGFEPQWQEFLQGCYDDIQTMEGKVFK